MQITIRSAPSTLVSRRAALIGLGAGLITSGLPNFAGQVHAAPLSNLVLFGPPAGPSITLAQAISSKTLAAVANEVSLKVWRSPDEMRAGLSSGTMSAVVMPVQVAANLYNRGMKLKLLNIMTEGMIYVLSADANLNNLSALRGKKIAVPFRNDMPDLVIRRLLNAHGLSPETDVTLESTGSPIEAMQMLMMGRVDAALAPEPAASAALIMAEMAGKELHRVIDVQELWGVTTGKKPILPQAGLVVTDKLMTDNPDLAAALQAGLEVAVGQVNADPAAAATAASASLDFPEKVLAASIATSKLVATRSTSARPSIEAMLETLAANDKDIIGGRMPDDGFYF